MMKIFIKLFARYRIILTSNNINKKLAVILGKLIMCPNVIIHDMSDDPSNIPFETRHKIDLNLELLKKLDIPVVNKIPTLKLPDEIDTSRFINLKPTIVLH